MYGQIATQLNLGQPKELMRFAGVYSSTLEEEQLENKKVGHLKDSRTDQAESRTEVRAGFKNRCEFLVSQPR